MPSLIPELTVVDFTVSLGFYRDTLGWAVEYERSEDEFAMLSMEGMRLMIDGLHIGRNFDVTLTPQMRPFGRGVNLEIEVASIDPLLASLEQAGWPLYLPLERKWYRVKDREVGQRQFIVADPDGYLLRFCDSLGSRPIGTADAL